MSTRAVNTFPSVVLPPEGWAARHEKWGLMALDNSPGGRLVRLADVLEHIERSQVLSRDEALSTMADGLRQSGGLGVFILSPGQRPRPLSAQDAFGFQPPASRAAPGAPGLGSPEWRAEFASPTPKVHATTRPLPGVDHGSPGTGVHALIQRLRTDWVSKGRGRALVPLDDESKQAARVAILLSQAHALWEFGHAVPLRPPASWSLETEWGYMARDATPGGRLVRLDDLVTWLSERDGIPSKQACRVVEDRLASLTNADLFNLRTDDYASPFDGSEDFTPGISERSFWEAQTNPDELGIASAKLWLSAGRCGHVAVLMTRAYELWGYGEPSGDSAQLQGAELAAESAPSGTPALKADPFAGLTTELRTSLGALIEQRGKSGQTMGKKGGSWADEQRVTAADAVAALDDLRTGTGVKTLAEALGISRQALEGVLDEDAVSKARKALNLKQVKSIAPSASVFTIGKAAQDKG